MESDYGCRFVQDIRARDRCGDYSLAMLRDVDLVIFDCDGVLVDSERLAVEMDVQIFGRFGLSISPAEAIERFMGRSQGLLYATVEEQIGRTITPAERQRFDVEFKQMCEERLMPVDGITEALQAIAQPTCVASSSEPDGLRWKLGRCGLLERFDGKIFSATQVARGKPAPDLFLFAAATLEVEPARCVVIEDSPYGVQAARAAGMRTLAYVAGMVPVAALRGPDTILFDDMRELPALI